MITISAVEMTMTVHGHSVGNNVHRTKHLCCDSAVDVVSTTTGTAAVTVIAAIVIHLASVITIFLVAVYAVGLVLLMLLSLLL